MHSIFVVNGFCFNTTAASPECRGLLEMLKSKGYRVFPINILWNYKTISQYADAFSEVYLHNKTEENTVLGNSFGAIVAFLTAPKLQPNHLILCSLSCYFKEDLHRYNHNKLLNEFGKKRVMDFKNISADSLAERVKKLKTEIILTYGEYENNQYPELVYRVKNTASKIPNSTIFKLPAALHSIQETNYVSGLSEVLHI